MKTLGIIGGLGPETTAEFYLEVVFGCQKINNEIRPQILICSVPMDLRMEKDAIVRGVGEEKYVPILVETAKRLENAGADFLVMPCNSLHAFIGEIRQSVKIPILSIIEETVNFMKEQNISSAGLISTVITKRHRLYENAFSQAEIKVLLPTDFEQAKIGNIIHHLVINRQGNKEREELLKIIEGFKAKGVEHVVLACTDLQLLLPKHEGINIHDTMKILADAVCRKLTI